ncbi:helix-turn-helix domain-containing protein [Ruminococcus sp. CLA-AA-H200]|uniref:Helix-turn-helix domain-containing protein n=1 Tax=Ruminococcus turbiniformis TaxID=2881258 RepID=A0ABS8FXI9_9FIRM|nr:helix-turn-helix transcriptional regulator [Ruminococcus turbiniformis]MCC2254756.1 helix-turn-helix domain-containing protein [Ruminococcus turbiniformis]
MKRFALCPEKQMTGKAEKSIGENIRQLRMQKGINQSALASELNIRRQTISAYERGVTLPDIFVLIRIADFFGITLDELTGRSIGKREGERIERGTGKNRSAEEKGMEAKEETL